MEARTRTIKMIELTLKMTEEEATLLVDYLKVKIDDARHDIKPLLTTIYLMLTKGEIQNETNRCNCRATAPAVNPKWDVGGPNPGYPDIT